MDRTATTPCGSRSITSAASALPLSAHAGHARCRPHQAPAHRHGGVAGAFYHPLRLAEEVALLDMLSGGRVNWGAGRGFARVEFKAFGVPSEESASRFREAVEIVLKAWTEESSTSRGRILVRRHRSAAQAVAAAASADLDGSDLGRRDRLGGKPRLLDPDGPAFLDGGDRRQAPPLRRQARGRGALGCGRDIPIARWWRWPRPRTKPRPSPAAGRNGWSIPTPDRSTPIAGPWSGLTTARNRRSTMSTASSSTARRLRSSNRLPACTRGDRPQLPDVRAAQPRDLQAASRRGSATAVNIASAISVMSASLISITPWRSR